MKLIEIQVHVADGEPPKAIKIAEDATIEQLLQEIQAAGAAIGESGEQIILRVEDKELTCRKEQKLHECGIKHGHHVHCHPHHFEIIVNARPRVVKNKDVTFEHIVELAFPGPHGPNIVFSMTYRHAVSKPHAGELGAGGIVEVKRKGTIFNVTRTDKS
jgi:hypothetical protein